MVRVLILKSGAPHQSQAPSSEFQGGKSSDLKIRGAPSQSEAPCSEIRGGKSSDLKIRGAPSVQGSFLGDQEYRHICLLDRRIGVFAPGSAYRRIGVPAYRRIGVFPARIGVSAYRRMCPLRAMRRRIGVLAYRRKAVLRHYLQARCDVYNV